MNIIKQPELTLFDSEQLNKYLEDDWVLPLVTPDETNAAFAADFGCNKWLIDSACKRMIFSHLYGDLMGDNGNIGRLNVLDVGGGANLCQALISQYHDLTVVDLLAHDKETIARQFFEKHNITLINKDWYTSIPENKIFDIVIANDLFPNVDQRLQAFIEKVSRNLSGTLRILLTFYNEHRSYFVKRVGASEYMTIKSWTGQDVVNCISSLYPSITSNQELLKLPKVSTSLYSNKRAICIFTLAVGN